MMCPTCNKEATHNLTWGDGVVTQVCEEVARDLEPLVGVDDAGDKFTIVSISKIGE